MVYIDDHFACQKTHVTLAVYPETLTISQVTERLGVEPTSWQELGKLPSDPKRRQTPAKRTAWFLETDGCLTSLDARRHMDWVLARFVGRDEVIKLLQAEGNEIRMWCYWLSKAGHGGPLLSPFQMRRLAELEINVEYDVYGL